MKAVVMDRAGGPEVLQCVELPDSLAAPGQVLVKGGRVIGCVSSESKAAIAKQAGADHLIVDRAGQFAEEAVRLSGGKGVDVVYDGSGPTTFQGSLDSLRI
jgi:NADPH:quinone reductase